MNADDPWPPTDAQVIRVDRTLDPTTVVPACREAEVYLHQGKSARCKITVAEDGNISYTLPQELDECQLKSRQLFIRNPNLAMRLQLHHTAESLVTPFWDEVIRMIVPPNYVFQIRHQVNITDLHHQIGSLQDRYYPELISPTATTTSLPPQFLQRHQLDYKDDVDDTMLRVLDKQLADILRKALIIDIAILAPITMPTYRRRHTVATLGPMSVVCPIEVKAGPITNFTGRQIVSHMVQTISYCRKGSLHRSIYHSLLAWNEFYTRITYIHDRWVEFDIVMTAKQYLQPDGKTISMKQLHKACKCLGMDNLFPCVEVNQLTPPAANLESSLTLGPVIAMVNNVMRNTHRSMICKEDMPFEALEQIPGFIRIRLEGIFNVDTALAQVMEMDKTSVPSRASSVTGNSRQPGQGPPGRPRNGDGNGPSTQDPPSEPRDADKGAPTAGEKRKRSDSNGLPEQDILPPVEGAALFMQELAFARCMEEKEASGGYTVTKIQEMLPADCRGSSSATSNSTDDGSSWAEKLVKAYRSRAMAAAGVGQVPFHQLY